VIEISGEVNNPGSYSILPGDTVLDVINKAGGYSNLGYSEGAVFLREEVAKQQKEAFERSAEGLEQTIVNIVTSGAIDSITEFTLAPINTLIKKLREQKPIGRQVVDFDILKLKSDPYKNFKVRDGDSIFIPKRPESVSVVGEVLSSITLRYDSSLTVEDYIKMSGGLNDQADKDRIFVIKPNGQAEVIKRTFFNRGSQVLPGSTIVVSRDTRPFDAVQITQIITPILADLATSAAAIAAISD
jgi:protein involved in polysaccharide export with SLBB domain